MKTNFLKLIVSIIDSCLENQFIVCLKYDYFHCFNIILMMWAGESQFLFENVALENYNCFSYIPDI